MSGPDDEEQRWRGRPWLAGLLRAAIVGVPVLLAAAVTIVGTNLLPDSSGVHWWVLHGLVFGASVVVALVAENLARRLLPVAMLLKLTLLFPDRAPSRFKVARKANAVRLLQESAARTDDEGAASTATAVLTLLAALTSHDKRTRGHAERVRVYAELLGEQLNLPPRDRDLLRWGALLHDIGKLEVAPSVLNKPGKPSEREWAMLRSHPQRGARLAAALMPWLGEWGGSILEHHERYDGTGYPAGLSGSGISRAGRLIAVVDAYEVMTAARSYKRAMSTLKARQELADCAGTHFDPLMVKAFLAVSLPRLLWATGPLSFLVQVPFITVLRDAGTRAAASVGSQTVSVAGAAVLATAGTVVGSALGPQAAAAQTPSAGAPPVHHEVPAPPGSSRPGPGLPPPPPPSRHSSGQPSGSTGRAGAPGGTAAAVEHRVEVTSSPSGTQTSTDAEIAFTVLGGGGAVCSIDSGPFGTCTSPLPLRGLSQGEHHVTIRPASGGPAQTVTWRVASLGSAMPPPPNPAPRPTAPTPTPTPKPTPTTTPTPTPPDTTAPVVTVTSGPPPFSASADAEVTFEVSEADAVVTCSLDGRPATRCVNSWTGTGLPEGPHTLRIRAVDAAGNVGTASRSWTVDRTAPALQVDTPAAFTRNPDAVVAFTAERGASVTCSFDGGPAQICDSPWSMAGLADGTHVLVVTATDSAGNATVVRRTWTVDTVAPAVTVTAGPRPQTADPDARVDFTVDDPTAHVTCSLDGAVATPCTSPWTQSGLADGQHVLTVTATDAAGNTGTAERRWTVDRVPPALRVDTGPAAVTRSTTATVTYTAEPGATVTCSLDDAPDVPCSNDTWTTTGLADGPHTLTVTATDAAGNATSVAHSWTVDTVPPTLTIDSGPSARTRSRAATVGFTAEAGSTVTCSLDGAAPTTCTGSWTGAGLPDGTHTLVLTATDAAHNTTTASWTWTVDTTAPALRVTSAPNGTSGRDVTVTFATDDPAAVVSCSLNGQPATDCSNGTWSGTHLGGGPQQLVITAADDLGNSVSVTRSWSVDTSAPSLTITDGPVAATSSPSATIDYTVDDPTAIVTCSLDGAPAAACPSPVTLVGLADGTHSLVLTATDTQGNSSSVTRTWTVDTVAPVLTVTSGPPASTRATSASVAFTVDDPSAVVTCSFDGGPAASCASPWTGSALADGPHRLVLTATDAAGNSSSVTRTWTVDTVAPVLTVTSAPPASTRATSASVAFTVDDPSAVVTCSFDGGPAAGCASPWTRSGISDGPHRLVLTATDAAGNSSSVTRSWTVDTVAPVLTVTSGPPASTRATSASVAFTVDDPSAVVTCSFDGGPAAGCASPWTRSGISDGPHRLVLTATDAAGNSSSVTRSWTVDTVAPVLTLTSTPPNTTPDTNATVSFSVDDPTATVTCSLDGANPTNCPNPWTAANLATGRHSLTLQATDAAGNSSSQTVTWTVDRSAPTIAISSGPTEVLVTTYFTLSGPNGTTFECSWDGGAWETCSSNPSKIMGGGTHTFAARGYRANGIRGPIVSTRWVAVL